MEQGSAQGSSSSTMSNELSMRWEFLKPVILDLYLDQDMHLSTVVNIMKKQYQFYAVEHSYKYYFAQWGVTKNIPGLVKDAAVVALGKRMRDQTSTPEVFYNNHAIGKKRLRRHITTAEKKKETADSNIQLSSNTFMVWNLPYRAFRSSSTLVDHFSPFPATPAFIHIQDTHVSPRNVPSPHDAPTPTALAIKNKDLNERARLFVQAKHEDLFKNLERSEKKLLTTYLYQFWLFNFKTAKHWGHGPQNWTAELLEFDRFKDNDRPTYSSANTPGSNVGTPAHIATPRSDGSIAYSHANSSTPPPLCNWSIHAAIRNRFEGVEKLEAEFRSALFGADGEDGWEQGPNSGYTQTFEDKIQAALESNSFSNLDPNDLPMAISHIVKATRRSPKELLQESFGFSVIARNEEIFWELLPQASATNFQNTGIYPFHLLTSFLDGSKTCCNLLDAALNEIAEMSSIQRLYVNNHGHTVLDNLLMTILKGHTQCRPVSVDDKLVKMKRFTGEEVDICGRWDADSVCVRELFAGGRATIPIEWKHMFCHTSVQTICHSIGRLFGPVFAPDINLPSGLFVKHCQVCGMKLQLLPLHSLVLIAVHLARSGCPGENLFGMLACLVCLLANGADPTRKAHISLDALMNRDNAIICSHEDLDPSQLAERVPESLVAQYTEEVMLGWQVFCSMLRYARDERRPKVKRASARENAKEFHATFDNFDNQIFDESHDESSDDSMDDESDVEEELCPHFKADTENFYGGSKTIGTLWAAIQTELVTYRRLTEDDPWISRYFDMRSLLDGLNNGGVISIPLVEEDMMNPFCQCGRFLDITDEACACVDEVCTDHFANLDSDWARTTYITIPENRNESWYGFY